MWEFHSICTVIRVNARARQGYSIVSHDVKRCKLDARPNKSPSNERCKRLVLDFRMRFPARGNNSARAYIRGSRQDLFDARSLGLFIRPRRRLRIIEINFITWQQISWEAEHGHALRPRPREQNIHSEWLVKFRRRSRATKTQPIDHAKLPARSC